MYKMRKQNMVTTPGFALPTVLVASVVLLMVLVTATSTLVAVGNGIRDQNYLRHAGLAAEAGEIFKRACLDVSGGTVTWSDSQPLRPNTDCSGAVEANKSAYVLTSTEEGLRTYFVVDSSLEAKGYTEVLRKSTGLAWRVWTNTASAAPTPGGAVMPVGTYIEGAWTTAPEGYLLADGSAVSRTTYANLFAVIGTTYGAGNGSTTFNLPNSSGRVTVARTTSTGATFTDQDGAKPFDTLGETSGKASHTLTTAQMPSHTHPIRLRNSRGNIDEGVRIVGTVTGTETGLLRSDQGSGGFGSTTDFSPLTVGSRGSGAAHNNIQPSIVVNRAIKY